MDLSRPGVSDPGISLGGRRHGVNYVLLLWALDFACINLALSWASSVRPVLGIGAEVTPADSEIAPPLHFLVTVVWFVVFNAMSVYSPRRLARLADQLGSVSLATITSTVILAGTLYLSYRDVSRVLFLSFFFIVLILLVAYRLVLHLLEILVRGAPRPTRILIVGAGQIGQDAAHMIGTHGPPMMKIVGFLDDDDSLRKQSVLGVPVKGALADLLDVIDDDAIDEVVLALPTGVRNQLVNLIAECHRRPISVRVVPDCYDQAFHRTTLELFGGMPLISLRDPAIDGFPRAVKRLMDVIGAVIAAILLAPIFAAIVIAIKLDSPGPTIFRSRRAGENGRPFWMFKFRSMSEGAEERLAEVAATDDDGTWIHKRAGDPRVTRVGALLRRTSLDELPQLWNVLKGEMSLVGPRPELPELVEMYQPWQRKRFAVPQGMTGWWQVNGRSDKPLHLHTEDDIFYIQNYSIGLDISILGRTVWVVLRGRGAF
ncbi:MAG: putative glycosyltransferase [Chloroflexi bacterium]|nr:putative glycosyltransferase [Chloroflexota bacterium]